MIDTAIVRNSYLSSCRKDGIGINVVVFSRRCYLSRTDWNLRFHGLLCGRYFGIVRDGARSVLVPWTGILWNWRVQLSISIAVPIEDEFQSGLHGSVQHLAVSSETKSQSDLICMVCDRLYVVSNYMDPLCMAKEVRDHGMKWYHPIHLVVGAFYLLQVHWYMKILDILGSQPQQQRRRIQQHKQRRRRHQGKRSVVGATTRICGK